MNYVLYIDAYGLKIQGRGYLKFLPKSLGGRSRLSGKIARGSPYFGFYCTFINKCFEICLGGPIFTLPLPPPPPLCASMNRTKSNERNIKLERKYSFRPLENFWYSNFWENKLSLLSWTNVRLAELNLQLNWIYYPTRIFQAHIHSSLLLLLSS